MPLQKSPKQYYVKSQLNSKYIMLKHGEKGYYETDITDENQVRALNLVHSNTAEDVEAASICSMHGNWDKFEEIKQNLISKRLETEEHDES